MADTVAPPGWPSRLAPPGHPDFEQAATGWLLDRCPSEYRGYPELRRHPVVLARLAVRHLDACVAGTRAAYAGARRDLVGVVGPEVIEETLRVLEREGARAVAVAGEAALVEEALRGRRWSARL